MNRGAVVALVFVSACATVTPEQLAAETDRCRVVIGSTPFTRIVFVDGNRAFVKGLLEQTVVTLTGKRITQRGLFGDMEMGHLDGDRVVYTRGLFMKQTSDAIEPGGVVRIRRGFFTNAYRGSAGCTTRQLALGAIAQMVLADEADEYAAGRR